MSKSTLMIGRPSVTGDAAVIRMLRFCFRNGLSIRQACHEVGISHEAYYRRMRADQAFADDMTAARQELAVSAKVNLYRAVAQGDLTASKWILEKEGFGIEVDHIIKQIKKLDSGQLNELAQKLQSDYDIQAKLNI